MAMASPIESGFGLDDPPQGLSNFVPINLIAVAVAVAVARRGSIRLRPVHRYRDATGGCKRRIQNENGDFFAFSSVGTEARRKALADQNRQSSNRVVFCLTDLEPCAVAEPAGKLGVKAASVETSLYP